jgi:hypothetical protein
MTLSTAANGHLTLDFDDSPETLWEDTVAYLLTKGFVRAGVEVFGPDQSIYPHFVRGSIILTAGWDIWSGKYLLSQSDPADDFLRALALALTFPVSHHTKTI